MEFEWDPKKSAANERKHDITFQEASTVFGDRLAMTFADPDHSKNEERYLTLGCQCKTACSLFHIRNVEKRQGL